MLKQTLKAFLLILHFSDVLQGPRPRTSTEKLLTSMFDSTAGQFLGILEALWDSSTRPLQTRILGDVELQEIALELLSAGVRILSGL